MDCVFRVEAKVEQEALTLGRLYRAIGSYPESVRNRLQEDFREYAQE